MPKRASKSKKGNKIPVGKAKTATVPKPKKTKEPKKPKAPKKTVAKTTTKKPRSKTTKKAKELGYQVPITSAEILIDKNGKGYICFRSKSNS